MHLKSLYSDSEVTVKVARGKGGSPGSVLKLAENLALQGEYEQCYVLLDLDVCTDKFLNNMEKSRFHLIGIYPCFECLALRILGFSKKDRKGWDRYSKKAKSVFKSEYLHDKNVINKKFCKDHFTKEKLEKRRSEISVLNELICLFEGAV